MKTDIALPVIGLSAAVLAYVAGAGPAMAMITVAMLLLIVACRPPARLRIDKKSAARVALAFVVAGLAWNMWTLTTQTPGFFIKTSSSSLRLFHVGIDLAAICVAVALLLPHRIARFGVLAMMCLHAALGVWIIQHDPDPGIDVFIWQEHAMEAMLAGDDPYGAGYPQMLPGTYPEQFVKDGDVRAFPYTPLTLILDLPGHLAGDLRWSFLLAIEGTALFLAFVRPTPLAKAAAALYLFSPGLFVLLQLSWTEPYASVTLAAATFALVRGWRRAAAVLLGLALGAKQYVVLGAAFVDKFFGDRFGSRSHLHNLALACGVAALVSLPFLLRGPVALFNGVVTFPLKTPFREDSYSYPSALLRAGGPSIPGWAGLIPPALALWWARKVPATPAGFMTGLALVLIVLFVWSTHAFSNYYFLVFSALSCGLAAWPEVSFGSGEDVSVDPSPRSA